MTVQLILLKETQFLIMIVSLLGYPSKHLLAQIKQQKY